MLYEIMKSIRNFFPTGTYKSGKFNIEEGTMSLSFCNNGDYVLIEGSRHNDGVHMYPLTDMTDEEFDGTISVLAPPADFLALASEIEAWVVSNGDRGAFTSESFGGYSYTKATNADGSIYDWKDAYKQRLSVWRKL